MNIPVETINNILIYLPNIRKYRIINKNFKTIIDDLIKHYTNIFAKISEDWENSDKYLPKRLLEKNMTNAALFLLNNYNTFNEYISFYAGYYGNNELIQSGLLIQSKLTEGLARRGIIDIKNYHKCEVLYNVARGGHLNIITGIQNISKCCNSISRGAARGGHLNIIEYIEKLCNINYESLAIEATNGKHLDLLKYIITKYTPNYNTIAEYAAKSGSFDILNFALQNGATNYITILSRASMYGRENIVKYMVNNFNLSNEYDIIAIYAAKGGNLNLIKYAIELGANNYDEIAYNAAMGGYLSILKYLKDNEINYERIAIIAAERCFINIVKYSLEMGAKNYDKIIQKSIERPNNCSTEMLIFILKLKIKMIRNVIDNMSKTHYDEYEIFDLL